MLTATPSDLNCNKCMKNLIRIESHAMQPGTAAGLDISLDIPQIYSAFAKSAVLFKPTHFFL